MGDKVAEWRRQVLLMEHDHMVQALAAQRPDHRSAIAFTCVVMVPSILMAQLKRSSLLTAVKAPLGGLACPSSFRPPAGERAVGLHAAGQLVPRVDGDEGPARGPPLSGRSRPQQASVPSVLTPQRWFNPKLTVSASASADAALVHS